MDLMNNTIMPQVSSLEMVSNSSTMITLAWTVISPTVTADTLDSSSQIRKFSLVPEHGNVVKSYF